MTAEEFKKAWLTDEYDEWTDIAANELAKTDLSANTVAFLSHGFPEDAAPYLSFGYRSFDGIIHNMDSYEPYSWNELGPTAKSYWIFGSDGAGNPICLDASNGDRVTLLDHESGFTLMDIINTDVSELASCLLSYKKFINMVNEKYGEDGFFDIKYTKQDVDILKGNFKEINENIFEESSFWKQEIAMLIDEIESDNS